MSLPAPAPRRHLHTRKIRCEGYQRDDGLWDIEARIVDTKTYETSEPFRGERAAGMHVHDMELRLTLDRDMVVRDIEVSTSHAPYAPCFTVAEAYKGLIGAKVGAGWRRAVQECVGGVKGCTHLRELLMPVATVAFQTMGNWPKEGESAQGESAQGESAQGESAQGETAPGKAARAAQTRPYFLDGCKAWSSEGAVVERLFPLHYRKPA